MTSKYCVFGGESYAKSRSIFMTSNVKTTRIATKLGRSFSQLLACFKTSKYYKKSPEFSTADRVHRALCGHKYFLFGWSLNATVSISCRGTIIPFSIAWNFPLLGDFPLFLTRQSAYISKFPSKSCRR